MRDPQGHGEGYESVLGQCQGDTEGSCKGKEGSGGPKGVLGGSEHTEGS